MADYGLIGSGGRRERQHSVEGRDQMKSFPLLLQSVGRLCEAPVEDIERRTQKRNQRKNYFLFFCVACMHFKFFQQGYSVFAQLKKVQKLNI